MTFLLPPGIKGLKAEVLRVITLVLLFLLRCRFLTQFFFISILQKRYAGNLVKSVRKLEKLDFKHKKAQLGLKLLQSCKKNNGIPKFLRFKLPNRHLSLSHAYNICQKRLLNKVTSNKHILFQKLPLNLTSLENDTKYILNIIDFGHITAVFWSSNNKNILNVRKVQGKKISKLCAHNSYYESVTSYDNEKGVFDFPNHSLTEYEKSLLSRGLNLVILNFIIMLFSHYESATSHDPEKVLFDFPNHLWTWEIFA